MKIKAWLADVEKTEPARYNKVQIKPFSLHFVPHTRPFGPRTRAFAFDFAASLRLVTTRCVRSVREY